MKPILSLLSVWNSLFTTSVFFEFILTFDRVRVASASAPNATKTRSLLEVFLEYPSKAENTVSVASH